MRSRKASNKGAYMLDYAVIGENPRGYRVFFRVSARSIGEAAEKAAETTSFSIVAVGPMGYRSSYQGEPVALYSVTQELVQHTSVGNGWQE